MHIRIQVQDFPFFGGTISETYAHTPWYDHLAVLSFVTWLQGLLHEFFSTVSTLGHFCHCQQKWYAEYIMHM